MYLVHTSVFIVHQSNKSVMFAIMFTHVLSERVLYDSVQVYNSVVLLLCRILRSWRSWPIDKALVVELTSSFHARLPSACVRAAVMRIFIVLTVSDHRVSSRYLDIYCLVLIWSWLKMHMWFRVREIRFLQRLLRLESLGFADKTTAYRTT